MHSYARRKLKYLELSNCAWITQDTLIPGKEGQLTLFCFKQDGVILFHMQLKGSATQHDCNLSNLADLSC